MLQNILGIGRSGLHTWWLQRLSALILACYFIFIVGFISLNHVTFHSWQALFSCFSMQLFTLLALLSLIVHAWIGIWIVLTDYVKIYWLRLILQIAVNIYLIGCLFAGILMLT